MKIQTVQEIENHPHYTDDYKYFMLRRLRRVGDNVLIKENNLLREEIEVTDKILAERTRVLEAVPPCDLHGSLCIPHALDWVADRMAEPDHLWKTN